MLKFESIPPKPEETEFAASIHRELTWRRPERGSLYRWNQKTFFGFMTELGEDAGIALVASGGILSEEIGEQEAFVSHLTVGWEERPRDIFAKALGRGVIKELEAIASGYTPEAAAAQR